jgi:uncharacterized phage protein (TIGR02220 family)
MHCLIKANFKDNYKGKFLIERGSFVTSCQILANELGYSKPTILRALRDLESTFELKRKTNNKGTVISITNYDSYQRGEPQALPQALPQMYRQVSTNNKVTKKQVNNNSAAAEIVGYLNSVSGKNFKATSAKTITLIQSRLNEKYTLEDFKHVIDIKCKQWIDDIAMCKYVRPETLFGNKFENYLNENDADSHRLQQEKKLIELLGGE